MNFSFSTLVKDAKTVVTVIGAVLMVLNEVLPVFPANAQHWVTGVIAVLTVVARDITDLVKASGVSAKGPKTQ